jgi:bifunctional non-homologous end joining protein LigD
MEKYKHTKKEQVMEGRPSRFPSSIRPMLAMPVDRLFHDDDWVFEVKWDGVRALLFWNKSEDVLRLQSRKGGDITHRYPEILRSVNSIRVSNSVVLDGEIVVLDRNGIPDFQRHQTRMNVDSPREISYLSRESPATYYVFDILYLDGLSLEGLDLISRREILSKVLSASGRIRVSDFIQGRGESVFKNAIAMGLEGIVAKYKYSKYLQGARSSAWLKIKGVLTQDCVVIGYTRGEGNREGYFGSLILAAYDGAKLRFVGHTGSGFGFDQLEETLEMMKKLAVDECPIDHVPYVNREPVWIRPELVVEVKFHGWTRDGAMRAPIFVRFREDKRPEDCVIEKPKDAEQMVKAEEKTEAKTPKDNQNFTNLEKVFWNASASHPVLKKKDLIEYYDRMIRYILPHLKDRPLSLSRYPDGIMGKSFYHKNWEQARPDYSKSIKIISESSNRIINYLLCNNRETLLWLANLGCIEMHPWYSRVHNYSACAKLAAGKSEPALDEAKCGLERPDFIIFDIDPYIYSGKEQKGQEPEYNVKGFKAAVDVAYRLKELFDSLKIRSYVKTSGKTGLHIFVPVAPVYTYDQTRAFAQTIGKILAARSPSKITMEWDTSKRKGKVFFDYNQNAKGKTVASIFSVRPTVSATVSIPLEWSQLDKVLPTDYTIMNVPEVLKASGDPWRDILEKKQDLNELLENVSEIA